MALNVADVLVSDDRDEEHPHLVAAHQVELFRINDNPAESANVADTHPEVVERLMKQLADFRKLQPKNAIPPYGEGKKGFVAPKEWKIVD